MFRQVNILYIHGMGGGGDSRIPAVLNEWLNDAVDPARVHLTVHVRTYSFDPAEGHRQIIGWMEEIGPDLVIGESLGAVHALRLRGVPHLLVSPALGAPLYFHRLAWMARIPGVMALAARRWRPRRGDRQPLDFRCSVLRRYGPYLHAALVEAAAARGTERFHAYFGAHDGYRRSGIVSVRKWRRTFGEASYTVYDGSHFMEEPFIRALLIPGILDALGLP